MVVACGPALISRLIWFGQKRTLKQCLKLSAFKNFELSHEQLGALTLEK